MIDPIEETLIPFSKLSSWCEKNLGNRVSPSSLHRWRLRGIRGVKLETILIGGKRHCSAQALRRFFAASTRAQDGEPEALSTACHTPKVSHNSDAAYLESQGI